MLRLHYARNNNILRENIQMGLFGTVDQEDLNKFRKEMQGQLDSFRDFITRSASESAEMAKEAADQAAASLLRVKNDEESVRQLLVDLSEYKEEATKQLATLSITQQNTQATNDKLLIEVHQAKLLYDSLSEKKEIINSAEEDVTEKVDSINGFLEQSKNLPQDVKEAKDLLAECKKLSDNISNLLTHSLNKKSEIDDLYIEIYGDEITNADSNTEHVDGLKDILQRAYDDISRNTDGLEEKINQNVAAATKKHNEFLSTQKDSIDTLIEKSKSRFTAINDQLTALLPGAMAAGLSAAYEDKKKEEIESRNGFDKNFKLAIGGLIAISSIPLLIDIYLIIFKSRDIVQILKDTPLVLTAVLPLYFPVLWFAYSSSKKSNLSKRLIEEYTHKAVLGRTFSGLSNQIETLEHQGKVKQELRTRLLFNVLQVSAENPGKLITDYNKSDHPLMEALENSVKLADSISALSKIPGFSAIVTKLSRKSEEILSSQKVKVEEGLDAQAKLESTEEDTDKHVNEKQT